MSTKNFNWVNLFLFVILAGCSTKKMGLEGQFIYIYPSGEVALLSVSNDHTYSQIIYKNDEDLENGGSPIYKSSGSWEKTGEDFAFMNWLSLSENRNPHEMLTHPVHVVMLDVYFRDSYTDSKDYISIYMENGFVFKRLE